MSGNYKVELTIVENGLDFIKRSLIELEKDDDMYFKYAILHLSAGLELILKARLQKEHWSLVFEDINKANLETFNKGEFKSVAFENLISRLEGICDIEMGFKTKKKIQNLKKYRNRIEHFDLSVNKKALEAITFKVLSVLIPFIYKEELIKRDHDTLKFINEKLTTMDDYITQRYKEISPIIKELPSEVRLLECPNCLQNRTLRLDEKYCYFCETTFKNLSVEFISRFLNFDEHFNISYGKFKFLDLCPCCEKRSLLVADDECLCITCCKILRPKEYVKCIDCGISHLFGKEEGEFINEEYVCYDCIFKDEI
ncbi:hypothetical protein JOC86_004513 [Bacillus pakistanensis]|uniref:Uncharacterized protein n=1 Tax=Rossellomorea pakistanensis TaxID=992288 RepID=A0ABS2NJA3_9BACI|nr:hypothetical protein [Bacillus pakistanensis]MBM7587938.1 hypothetical protein [Bacillus pakistanensis]